MYTPDEGLENTNIIKLAHDNALKMTGVATFAEFFQSKFSGERAVSAARQGTFWKAGSNSFIDLTNDSSDALRRELYGASGPPDSQVMLREEKTLLFEQAALKLIPDPTNAAMRAANDNTMQQLRLVSKQNTKAAQKAAKAIGKKAGQGAAKAFLAWALPTIAASGPAAPYTAVAIGIGGAALTAIELADMYFNDFKDSPLENMAQGLDKDSVYFNADQNPNAKEELNTWLAWRRRMAQHRAGELAKLREQSKAQREEIKKELEAEEDIGPVPEPVQEPAAAPQAAAEPAAAFNLISPSSSKT